MENFNRTSDVSKLIGSNSRNVAYRWETFQKHLRNLPASPDALDFGAGSMRDSFELVSMNFNVKSVDIDIENMKRFMPMYTWPKNRPTPQLIGDLDELEQASDRFLIITAFDVLEHLERPQQTLKRLGMLLAPEGLLFCTVPNSISILELFYRILNVIYKITGKSRTPGVPHIQFSSPGGWRIFFESNGFNIVEHSIEIGFLANTYWGLWQIPLLVTSKLVRVNLLPLMNFVGHRKIMGMINRVDRLTSKLLRKGYAWNIFVLNRQSS